MAGSGVRGKGLGQKKPKCLLRREDELSGEEAPSALTLKLWEKSGIYGVGGSHYLIDIRGSKKLRKLKWFFPEREM